MIEKINMKRNYFIREEELKDIKLAINEIIDELNILVKIVKELEMRK